ncbi:MAG: 3-dehydroquinate synthase [Ardenticatenales bacterium]|nr:3-dehydroquinate synthase [Ardenticatenales bacterium]MCB9172409.1 3-dehydroquinate synthase [Ardenticatenales bacterium]
MIDNDPAPTRQRSDPSLRTGEAASTLVLTGFMGVGKTTVGRALAARLQRPFVDLDQRIAALTGRDIPALFAEGEATFRAAEAAALRGLPSDQPLVIATGGGTLIGRANQRLLDGATLVCLDAPLSLLQTRLGNDGQRPLAAEAQRLYAERRAAYQRLPLHVDVAGRTVAEIVAEIVGLRPSSPRPPSPNTGRGGRFSFHVPTPHGEPYPILIGNGIGAEVGAHLAAWGVERAALITDQNVGPLWGESVRHDILAAGLPTTRLTMAAGEVHKTQETVATLYDGMAAAAVARGDGVVALGGGVVGDVAGFVAATWMRGLRRVVQMPTTLLAMVDASVGGKTGVDHPAGKNLIGAFRFPDLVLIDPEFLTTLPDAELRNGMAEVIKHGVIADPALFDTVLAHKGPLLDLLTADFLARAVQVKVEIVTRDPFERGERALLNLGHTFAHGYELVSGYAISHGEAVAMGMVTAARLSERLGMAVSGLAGRIAGTLEHVGLPTAWHGPDSADALWAAMQQDKKRTAAGLRFVLPRDIGDCVLTEAGAVSRADVAAVLCEGVGV